MDEQTLTEETLNSEVDGVETLADTSPLQSQLETLTAALQRERADFINYKKRVEREQEQMRSKIGGDVLNKFLPVVDDFERALESIPSDQQGSDWVKGMTMIIRKLNTILEAEGVVTLNPLGEPFDPNFHEVIGMDEPTETCPSQHVSAVLQKGYRQGDRVLRPAMVRVAN